VPSGEQVLKLSRWVEIAESQQTIECPVMEAPAAEKTLDILTSAEYQSVFEGIGLQQRITHPGSHGFPDARFDYLFGKNLRIENPVITKTNVSDHLPVSCDVMIK